MNPFATGTSAGHAPRRSDGEHEKRERAENHGSSREDENGEGTWKRRKDEGESRKGAREKRRKRGETEKWSDRTARRRPRLVIYIESYLHLNVFIFNARPRNGLSTLGGFVSAPHLLRPLNQPFTCFCLAPFRLLLKTASFVRSLLKTGGTNESSRNVSRRLTRVSPTLLRWSV